ncbi:MAG: translation elongation factor Ts [Candidatus Taylorbacteria bacterium]
MITTDQIKALRDETGISVMQCKKALEEANGDKEKALIILRKKGGDIASKKADRMLGAGIIASYIHGNGNVGTLIELSCETDFVSKNQEFIALAHDIAMHVAASNPEFVKFDEVSEEAKNKAREVFAKDIEGKPANMKEKIMEGKLNSFFGEKVLLNQPFIKNPEMTIGSLIEGAIQKFGEKIEVSRFTRFSVLNK